MDVLNLCVALHHPRPTTLLESMSAKDWSLWRAFMRERSLPHVNAENQAAVLSYMYHASHVKKNTKTVSDFLPWFRKKPKKIIDPRKHADYLNAAFGLMKGMKKVDNARTR